ncbi:MAG TPA: response regulator transcription factor [Micromonosporaceae bacterium]|nr:response regulator transcription factor [Micromonosporaceae bacterium]
MGTVLVCVRSTAAAQGIATCAARLGVAAIRTAVSEAEALAHLAEGRADVVLADTHFVRPDPVAFTRRVLWRAPEATLVLFGPEEPDTAAAVVAAGARGVIRGPNQDLVTVVAKALLLLCPPPWPSRPAATPPGASAQAGPPPGNGTGPAGAAHPAAAARPAAAAHPAAAGQAAAGQAGAGQAGAGHPAGPGGRSGPAGPAVTRAAAAAAARAGVSPPTPLRPAASGHAAGPASRSGASGAPSGGAGQVPPQRRETAPPRSTPHRRLTLTERELQVLRAMAEGRSNAEIGRELFVSEDTVKTHARRLFRKLGVRDRAHAVAAGFRAGLVT